MDWSKFNIIKNIYLHIKYNRILKKVYKSENLLDKLSGMFKTKVKIDWVGRIYFVLNVNQISVNDQVYEYGNSGLNNVAFINKWVLTNLSIVSKFIRANNLFELLTYDIEAIDYDNYLFILKPLTFDNAMFAYKLLIYTLLTIGCGIMLWFLFL